MVYRRITIILIYERHTFQNIDLHCMIKSLKNQISATMIEDLHYIISLLVILIYFTLLFCALMYICEEGCKFRDEQTVMEMETLKENLENNKNSRTKTFNVLNYRNIYGNTNQSSIDLVNSSFVSDVINV